MTKYEYIFNDLISQINSGKYTPGSELPSEADLTKIYSVSRITVRRAIDELYRTGYIDKQQGKRGYVRETAITQQLNTISSYTEEILRKGMTPSRKVVSSALRLCTKEEQQRLALDKAEPVFFLQRIVCANKKPLCYTEATLPYQIFRDIENYDFSKRSLYDIIENEYGISIQSSVLKLKAISANQCLSKHLEVEQGIPLLFSSAVTYGEYNKREVAIEMFKTYYLTDRFEYTLVQQRH